MLRLPKSKTKLWHEPAKWIVSFAFSVVVVALFAQTYNAMATVVQPLGRVYYGDGTNTALQFALNNTFDYGFGAEVSFTHGGSSSLIAHTVSDTAPTRDEIMVGSLKVDGELMVIKGVNGYDVSGDYSLAWSNAGTTGTQTCNSSSQADCTRAFDIEYEALSGRAMVLYADTTDQKVYYCYWDGSAWGPQSACTPTASTNDVTLSNNGRPIYISLKARPGTNELAAAIAVHVGSALEVEIMKWDGSSWGTHCTGSVDATLLALDAGGVVDLEWDKSNGTIIAIYGQEAGNGTTNRINLQTLPFFSCTTQGGPTSVGSNNKVTNVQMHADPVSNRILYTYIDDGCDSAPAVYKQDDSTDGWTLGNEDLLEGCNGSDTATLTADVAWEHDGTEGIWAAFNAGNAVDYEYQTVSCTSTCTFGSVDATIVVPASSDDGLNLKLTPSVNSDDIMMFSNDIDRSLVSQHWSGSAWEGTINTAHETATSPGSGLNTVSHGASFNFSYIPYSPWSRNWRFYNGTDTTDTPTTALANENTAVTGFARSGSKFRLRFSVIELSGQAKVDGRLKLQYTAGENCTPNTVESDTDCTWTDVDDVGGSGRWRYVDCNGGSSVCDDNTTLGGTVLSGSPTAGWWTQDKDAAGGSNMDHNALQLRELEYSVESNDTLPPGTTFYFRMYDIDSSRPVYREQDNDGSNDCASSTCTYPNLTTVGPSTAQSMRHGNWFDGGVEQSFYWAD